MKIRLRKRHLRSMRRLAPLKKFLLILTPVLALVALILALQTQGNAAQDDSGDILPF